jgi:ParB family chromosome partitioning protein
VVLVAGRHRLEACKTLKHKTIAAIVEEEDSPAIEHWRALAAIDENLIRRKLTAPQRAKLVAQRKKLYEAVHPETKHGGAPGKAGGGKKAKGESRQNGDFGDDRFTADTASKTGRSERSVQRDVARGAALGDDLDRIEGTSLGKGSELDALAAMPPEQRAPLIERAVSGETVSAVALAAPQDEPRQGYSELVRTWRLFRSAMQRASPTGRDAFLDEFHDEVGSLTRELA